MNPALLLFNTPTLVHLSPVDLVIIVFYFALVLAIGLYLKEQANTGEDFFMAGREMTAWVAGLAFLSANLGSLELMGWAGNSYKYGILAAHWYWIGAIPAMLFLALVMMPFYHICKTHSVPGYLKLRFGPGAQAISSVSFAFMTVLMSGINMYAMAVVMRVVLGWDLNFSILVSSITVAAYVALGGLRSAIFNEVLQFFLIWAGALLIPILGLVEAGGWSGMKAKILQNLTEQHVANPGCLHPRVVDTRQLCRQSHGHQLGRDCLRTRRCDLDGLLDHRFPRGAARSRGERFALGETGAHHRRGFQDDGSVHRHSARPARAGAVARSPHRQPAAGSFQPMLRGPPPDRRPGLHGYDEVLPLMLARYCGPGLLGLGITALIAGFMSGMAGNVSAFTTVWTYDIYGALINKNASDESKVRMGRWVTIIGVVVSIGTAYLVMHAQSIMDYVQSLFSFFIAPLFGTVILGMLWKRATPAGGWTGLLAGTLSSVGMYAWVKVDPDRGEICRSVAASAGSGAEHVSRPLVLADLRDRHGGRQPPDQTEARLGIG